MINIIRNCCELYPGKNERMAIDFFQIVYEILEAMYAMEFFFEIHENGNTGIKGLSMV